MIYIYITFAPGDSEDDDAQNGPEDEDIEEDKFDLDMDENDGMQAPKDVQQACFDEGSDGISDTSDEEMQDYDGDALSEDEGGAPTAQGSADDLPAPNTEPSPGTPHHGHPKMYHLSHEWQQLGEHGPHLQRLPPVIGCGINRHPAKSFWSCRYPGFPIKSAAWTAGKSPLKCLIFVHAPLDQTSHRHEAG